MNRQDALILLATVSVSALTISLAQPYDAPTQALVTGVTCLFLVAVVVAIVAKPTRPA